MEQSALLTTRDAVLTTRDALTAAARDHAGGPSERRMGAVAAHALFAEALLAAVRSRFAELRSVAK